MNRTTASFLTVATLAAGLAGAAVAQNAAAPADTAQPRLTMAQAVVIAEYTVKGQVVKAKLDRDDDAMVYKLTVATADRDTVRVRIAGENGKVLSTERR